MIVYIPHIIAGIIASGAFLIPSLLRLMADNGEQEMDIDQADYPPTLFGFVSSVLHGMFGTAGVVYPDEMEGINVTHDVIESMANAMVTGNFQQFHDIEAGNANAPLEVEQPAAPAVAEADGGGGGNEGGDNGNGPVCMGCQGYSTGGPQLWDNNLPLMADVYNNIQYLVDDYDPACGVSITVHSIRKACDKFNDLHPFGSVSAKFSQPSTDAERRWNERYSYDGDTNSINVQDVPPFKVEDIASDDLQDVANVMRGVIVVFRETVEDGIRNTCVERRVDPQYAQLGLGEYHSHVRVAMYLQRFQTGDGVDYYELIFPKNSSVYQPDPSYDNTFDIDKVSSTPIFTVDRNKNITGWNTCATNLTGISRNDALNHSVTDVLTPEIGTTLEDAFQADEEDDDGPSSYVFEFNTTNQANSKLKQLPAGGNVRIQDNMMINKQYDDAGQVIRLIIVRQRRDAFGNVPFEVDYANEGRKEGVGGRKFTIICAGEVELSLSLGGSECSANEQKAAYNKIMDEFDMPRASATLSINTKIRLENYTKDEIVKRVHLCGGGKIWNQGQAIHNRYSSETYSGYLLSKETMYSKTKLSLAQRKKNQQVDIDRANAKLVAKVNSDYNPEDYDKNSTSFEDVFNLEKIRSNQGNGCGSTFNTAMNPCKTSLVHGTPRNAQDGEFAHLSPEFLLAKYGIGDNGEYDDEKFEKEIGVEKLRRYKDLAGRLCIAPPREISSAFLPSFLVMSKWEREETYLSMGSGWEAAQFSRTHSDNIGPRANIHNSFDKKEGLKQFVYVVHHSDAAQHYNQTGGLNAQVPTPGCERLGTGLDAMPVYAAFEIEWNYYYGAEYATITKFFDKYNFCKPECVDLNDFSAKWDFVKTAAEDAIPVVV